jgi:predicted Ser/Thr protein kinase
METDSLRPGDPHRLGDYELLGRLGEGGQGVVYLGRTESGNLVAVKLLRAEIMHDAVARDRFLREAAAAKRVARFCTAQVLDVGLANDRPFIVSEYVQGLSLKRAVTESGPRTGGALERLAVGTATALAAIHEAGVVHRDFKPSNVLLGPDGPRVIDFGIARALDATTTTTPHLVGSPPYMAPEQIGGAPLGPAADMFAWGATMVFAANGTPPFQQSSIPAAFHQILHGEPELGELSGTLRELVAACLCKDPARRPTAHQVLRRLLAGGEATVPADTLVMTGALIVEELADPQGLREGAEASAAAQHPTKAGSGLRRARWALVATVVVIGIVAVTIAVAAPQLLRPDGGRSPMTWRSLPDLGVAVDSPGVAVLGNKLWVVGGLLPPRQDERLGRATNRVWIYDRLTRQWQDGPILPRPLDHAAVASDGHRLYVVGGQTDSGGKKVVQRSVYVLDETNPIWRLGPPLPEPRAEGAAAWDDQRLIFAGGVAEFEGRARAEVWTLEGSRWRRLGELQRARQHLAAATDGNGRTWFLGGRDGSTPLGFVDLVVGDDIRLYAQVSPVSSPAAVWHPDAGVCLLGGRTRSGVINSVTCLTEGSRTESWPALPQARFGASAAVLHDAVYLVGGVTAEGTTGRVDVLELER